MLEQTEGFASFLGIGIFSVSGGGEEEECIEEKASFSRGLTGLELVWWRVRWRRGRWRWRRRDGLGRRAAAVGRLRRSNDMAELESGVNRLIFDAEKYSIWRV